MTYKPPIVYFTKKLFLFAGIAFLFFAPYEGKGQEVQADSIPSPREGSLSRDSITTNVPEEKENDLPPDPMIRPEKQKKGPGIKLQHGDTLIGKTDSIRPQSPKKAALLSAALPGMGQIYNKKYWKVPVIYAGLGGLGLNIGIAQSQYTKYREEYVSRITQGTSKYPAGHEINRIRTTDLPAVADGYRKSRDLFIIGSLAFYLLNVVDASVDAHLYSFDVSEDLGLIMAPNLNYCFASARTVPSLSLKLKF